MNYRSDLENGIEVDDALVCCENQLREKNLEGNKILGRSEKSLGRNRQTSFGSQEVPNYMKSLKKSIDVDHENIAPQNTMQRKIVKAIKSRDRKEEWEEIRKV